MIEKKESKLIVYLTGTVLVLNIILTGASLYTMYRKGGTKKKCSCQDKAP